jgi:hypothetical protein
MVSGFALFCVLDQITWPLQHDTLQDHPFGEAAFQFVSAVLAQHNLAQQSVRKTLDFLVNVTCGCVDTLFCCRQQLKSFTWSSRLCQVDTQRFALFCVWCMSSALLGAQQPRSTGLFNTIPCRIILLVRQHSRNCGNKWHTWS